MIWLKWFPWKYAISRLAKSHGFIDPIALLARLHRFAQPSEVAEPIELVRAGVVLHARGLINSRVIQHNLDWLWPYWIERQFDPRDPAFVPRAFSITHINLTNRNWTAVGIPDCNDLPIIDPRGLLTPFLGEWSLDCWLVTDGGEQLLPARLPTAEQQLRFNDELSVRTEMSKGQLQLTSQASVVYGKEGPVCRLQLAARAQEPAWLVVALRPYNPEGISLIHQVALTPDRTGWLIEEDRQVRFSKAADRHQLSYYRHGDVLLHLQDLEEQTSGTCNVGMLTAAALFKVAADQPWQLLVEVPLSPAKPASSLPLEVSWPESLANHCALEIPDRRLQFLYEAALRTLILHSPGDVYPGPFTYKRFWFRDAAFIIHGLLCAGLTARAERALDRFPARQSRNGYFHSQAGEWDSNGQVLWIMERFCRLTGRPPKEAWLKPIRKAARWIIGKRLSDSLAFNHAGLLPAGFSAEHLGPNDFYYWDDYWGVAGLRSAAALLEMSGDPEGGAIFSEEADKFWRAIELTLVRVEERLGQKVIPASPYRRLDAGAIGSLSVGYPLQLCGANDQGLLNTVDFLRANCMFDDSFFQDMIHSGINPYLTLHMAQVLLRAGDPAYLALLERVAGLASATGQWPEAIHPLTLGGCMGDGQHAWAAAEWLLMIRNCFVREEGNSLIIGAGVPAKWLADSTKPLTFGPAPTSFGTIWLTISRLVAGTTGPVIVSWQGKWHDRQPPISVHMPDFLPRQAAEGEHSLTLIS